MLVAGPGRVAQLVRPLMQVQVLHHKMFWPWWSFAWGYTLPLCDDVLDVQYILSCMGCFVVRCIEDFL